MTIYQTDKERLKKFREKVASLRLRFPIAMLAEKMEMDRGNFSSYYNGKKRLTDKFLERFYKAVAAMDIGNEYLATNLTPITSVEEEDHFYQSSVGINELSQKIEHLARKQAELLDILDKFAISLDHFTQIIDQISNKAIDTQHINKNSMKTKQPKRQALKKKKPTKR